MGKVSKVRQLKFRSKIPSLSPKCIHKQKKCSGTTCERKDWAGARCSVCMESPHNAVLLLCSSYDKGCRPYMCATGNRFSNCLDQYKKAYTKLTSLQCSDEYSCELSPALPNGKTEEIPQLSCPICRGLVKGWTVVEPARKDLNRKKRSCMQENCSFKGSFKQLRKHVKADHPLSPPPREVDPAMEEKWKDLESERERNDVISAITSSDPGAIVMGDFVIEGGQHPFYRIFDDLDDLLGEGLNDLFQGGGGGGRDRVRSSRQRLGLMMARRRGRFRGVPGRGMMLP